jgi:hypothetical protein
VISQSSCTSDDEARRRGVERTDWFCWIWLIRIRTRSLVNFSLKAKVSVWLTSLPAGDLSRTRVSFLPQASDWRVRESSDDSKRNKVDVMRQQN